MNITAELYNTDAMYVLQERYPNQLSGARGVGMFCAVDVRDAKHRDKLLTELRNDGWCIYLSFPL